MKEKFKYILVAFLTAILLPISVFAKESVELKIDKTDLKVGDDVLVTASIPNKMEAYAIMATLKYDKNVFQIVSDSNFTIKNDESIKYSKETNKFGIINKTGKITLNDGDTLFTVNLKVKDDANVGNTNIALTNITYTDGNQTQNLDTTSLKVLVTKDAKDGEAVPTNKENKITEDEENIIKVFNNVPLIIILGVLVIIGLIINNKSKDNSDNKKKMTIYALIAFEVFLALITVILLWLNFSKTDVNNDGTKDYHDAEEIIDYLINIESSKEDQKEKNKLTNKNTKKPTNKYDVNNDGKVDIEDVGNTTEQIEKNTKVTLKELKEDNEYYVEKGKVTLKFTADITPKEAKITRVKIDNKYYKVELVSGVYIVTLDNVNEAGVHNFKIEEVELSNGVKRNTNLKITKEVLKDRPVVDDLSHNVKTGELTFSIKDKDKALQSARITIFEGNITEEDIRDSEKDTDIVVDEDGNTLKPDDFDKFKIILEEKLDTTKNSFKFNPKLEMGGVYTVVVTGNYDLDSKLGDNKNYYEEQFLNNGLNVITVGKVTLTSLSKEEIFLTKESQYDYLFDVNFEPKEITQDIKQVLIGEEYKDVTYEDGHLKLVLDDTITHGVKNVHISAVKLNDETDVLCDHDIKYDVLKDKPAIKDLVYHKGTSKVSFTLEDKDNAVKDAKITITSSDNKEVYKEELNLDNKEYVLNDVKLAEGSTYNINVTGNYDLDSDINNGKNYRAASLDHEITIYKVTLENTNSNADKIYYVEKNGDLTLKFKAIITPKNENATVSQVVIDNQIYKYGEEIEKADDGTYSINIKAPDKAGERTYTLENIIIDDEEIINTLNLKVDVLNQPPIVENLLINESKNIPEITFDLIDEDEAFKSGNVIIAEENGIPKEFAIKKGENTIKLDDFASDLEDGGTFNLNIQANYQLNHNITNKDYHKESKNLIETKQFKIYTAKLNLDEYNKYVKKGENKEFNINSVIEPTPSEDVTIKSFILDNNEVININDKTKNTKNTISMKMPTTFGAETYNITKAILSNGIEIKVNSDPISVYVLKDIPYINKLNLSEDNGSISYELSDPDEAFTGGKITIKGINNQSIEKDVQKEGTAKIEYEFNDGESYLVKVVGSYDLDDTDSTGKNELNSQEMSSQSFIVGGEYNFTLTNASITDAINIKEKPVITFKSTNSRSTIVHKANISIDGKDKKYDVVKTDQDTYQVNLTNADVTPGKHIVTLDSVEMNNGAKTFVNGNDYHVNEMSYTVLKEAPSVKDLQLEVDKANKLIKAKFGLNNPNYALRKLNVVLVESNGKIVASKELIMEEFFKDEINVELSYNGSTDGRYTVKVLADYELADKYTYTNTNIGDATILVYSSEEIRIERMYVVNSKNEEQKEGLFPLKNQKDYQVALEVYVADSVKARGYGRVAGVTINGVNYPAHQISGYKSKVFINVPKDAGILELTASRVQLANDGYYKIYNDYYSVPEYTLKLDVLKDKPKIENLKMEENYEKDEVTFNFDVVLDKTANKDEFTDGTITLNKDEQPIHVGSNTVKFTDVPKNETFDLIFKGTYDLDTNKLEDISADKNKTTKGEFYKVKYGLYDDNTYNTIAIDEAILTSAKENKYFEKAEKIKAKLKISGINEKLGVTPSKVVVKDEEYNLTKLADDYYEVVLDGYSSSGEKNITVTDIILSNSKKVNLNKPFTFTIEVLKDIPKINDYNFQLTDNDLTINIDLKDTDAAIVGYAHLKITDELHEPLFDKNYQNKVVIDRKDKDNILRYYVEVTLDYDRDIDKGANTDNHNSNVLLLDELISLEKNNIELKNITDINVYKKEKVSGEDVITLMDDINVEDIKANFKDYFVEVSMEDMPNTYVEIEKVNDKNGMLVLSLKYEYVTKENSAEEQTIEVEFGAIKDGKASNEFHPGDAFKVLLEKLEKGDSVSLDKNYDASKYKPSGNTYVTKEYSGKLNGNGYTIKNLTKPLFNTLNGATIENLRLESINFANSETKGTLAQTANSSNINGVLINDYVKTSTESNTGTLLGAINKTTVENCRVTNFKMAWGWHNIQQVGGLISTATDSTIKNNYIVGSIDGGWNFRAGLIGKSVGSTIEFNYTKVHIGDGMGSDIVYDITNSDSNTIIRNNLTINTGNRAKWKKSVPAKEMKDNYYIGNEDDFQTNGMTKTSESNITTDFFRENLQFDDKIWYLKNNSVDNLPKLAIETKTKLEDVNGFENGKETLYSNLMKLNPYYDSKKIVSMGKNIDITSILNEKDIKHIVPIDGNGSIVTYLTSDNPKKISKLKIIFSDGTKAEYKVLYDKTYDMVATYKISDLNIDYNYEHYVINAKSQVVINLTNYLKGLDYTNNLDILTTNDDSRLYRDFYNENTKNNLEEFVLKYLSNSEYTNTTENNNINDYLESTVKKDKKLERALYVYNYFKRFYDLDIDGMKVYDFIMFNMKGFDDSLTTDKIVDLYLAKSNGENFNTNQTNTRYNEVLGKYTSLDTIPKFVEYLVSKLSNHNLSEWTHSQFKGILEEIPLESAPNVKYTLWDHFISESNNEILNQFLPMLTLPDDAAYVISMPVQYIIGAQRTYIVDPSNPEEVASLKEKMDTYIVRMKRYFETAYAILQDDKLFNDILIYSVDKRLTKTETGSVSNTAYTTTEPFHKNFVEATGLWAASAGVNAAAWGPRLEWQVAGILDSTLAEEGYNDTSHVTFRTWSHESAHLIDARLFLRNNGRRFDAGGEDYADNFLMQSFDRNSITMNLSMMMDKTADSVPEATEAKLGPVASNLTPERINSPVKIQDFYRKLFETVYVMDYIEAKAFLSLPKDTQKTLGIQISYPNEDRKFQTIDNKSHNYDTEPDMFTGNFYKDDIYAKYLARQVTKYTRLNETNFDKDLNTIDDLIDNRIMLYPGVYRFSSRGTNSYGGEGINTVHWYQPWNPDGRPDSYSLKWISYEMLGWKGYDNGFVEYASNINHTDKELYKSLVQGPAGGTSINKTYKSDTMALKQISNNEFSNFSVYKKYRFKEIEDKINRLDSVIDVDQYINKFADALKKDANDIDVNLKNLLEAKPGCPSDYWCSRGDFATYLSYQYSTAVRQEIYYKLKTETNDFTKEIFK